VSIRTVCMMSSTCPRILPPPPFAPIASGGRSSCAGTALGCRLLRALYTVRGAAPRLRHSGCRQEVGFDKSLPSYTT